MEFEMPDTTMKLFAAAGPMGYPATDAQYIDNGGVLSAVSPPQRPATAFTPLIHIDYQEANKLRAWARVPVTSAAPGKPRTIWKRVVNVALAPANFSQKAEPLAKRSFSTTFVSYTLRGQVNEPLFDSRVDLKAEPGLWDLMAAQLAVINDMGTAVPRSQNNFVNLPRKRAYGRHEMVEVDRLRDTRVPTDIQKLAYIIVPPFYLADVIERRDDGFYIADPVHAGENLRNMQRTAKLCAIREAKADVQAHLAATESVAEVEEPEGELVVPSPLNRMRRFTHRVANLLSERMKKKTASVKEAFSPTRATNSAPESSGEEIDSATTPARHSIGSPAKTVIIFPETPARTSSLMAIPQSAPAPRVANYTPSQPITTSTPATDAAGLVVFRCPSEPLSDSSLTISTPSRTPIHSEIKLSHSPVTFQASAYSPAKSPAESLRIHVLRNKRKSMDPFLRNVEEESEANTTFVSATSIIEIPEMFRPKEMSTITESIHNEGNEATASPAPPATPTFTFESVFPQTPAFETLSMLESELESANETSTDPIIGPSVEPVIEPVVEIAIFSTAKLATEAAFVPAVEAGVVFVAEAGDSSIQDTPEPAIETATEPTAEAAATPVVASVLMTTTQAPAEAAVVPVVEAGVVLTAKAGELSILDTTEPAVETATEPTTEAAAVPAAAPGVETSLELQITGDIVTEMADLQSTVRDAIAIQSTTTSDTTTIMATLAMTTSDTVAVSTTSVEITANDKVTSPITRVTSTGPIEDMNIDVRTNLDIFGSQDVPKEAPKMDKSFKTHADVDNVFFDPTKFDDVAAALLADVAYAASCSQDENTRVSCTKEGGRIIARFKLPESYATLFAALLARPNRLAPDSPTVAVDEQQSVMPKDESKTAIGQATQTQNDGETATEAEADGSPEHLTQTVEDQIGQGTLQENQIIEADASHFDSSFTTSTPVRLCACGATHVFNGAGFSTPQLGQSSPSAVQIDSVSMLQSATLPLTDTNKPLNTVLDSDLSLACPFSSSITAAPSSAFRPFAATPRGLTDSAAESSPRVAAVLRDADAESDVVPTMLAVGTDQEADEDRQNLQAFLNRSRQKKLNLAKRRSGSLGTTAAGSPISTKPSLRDRETLRAASPEKLDFTPQLRPGTSRATPSPRKRKALGPLDTNSPSPAKHKRKHEEEGVLGSEPATRASPKSVNKRQRRAEPDATEREDAPPTLRRSGRRVALDNAAPSATAAAQSKIPVKLPGQAAGGYTNDTIDLMSKRNVRNDAKDLAALTRQNTAHNRGAATPTQMLERLQSSDDDMDEQLIEPATGRTKTGSRSTHAKDQRVSFANPLAVYQEKDDITMPRDEILVLEETKEKQPSATPKRKALKAATPARKMPARAATLKTALPTPTEAKPTPKSRKKTTAADIVESVTSPKAEGAKIAKAPRPPTRRSKLPTLGSINGTPAPKRRSTRTIK